MIFEEFVDLYGSWLDTESKGTGIAIPLRKAKYEGKEWKESAGYRKKKIAGEY